MVCDISTYIFRCAQWTWTLLATIAHLRSRKQHYKLKMFERLYHILLFAVLVILIFFVVSTMSFSGRLAEGIISLFTRKQSVIDESY